MLLTISATHRVHGLAGKADD
jgi:kynurenine 3-monooxygenase